ncbi:MAG: hypothetical protein A2X83_00785 [Desulfuromonadales bacterium GWD2_54_10]|nr:MAG: hypothetical protein A2X83_00785 [Desulfuromonadales bacterium GWD2_54_10]
MQDYTDNKSIKSYKQILKSTFIMGGSSIIVTLLGIVRTKIIALILGPTGVGLTGIYMSITSLVSTISGMGIRESGVQQIAGALGTDDQIRMSRTVRTLRRTALISGSVGLFLLLFMSGSISRLTFGNSEHTYDIALLSIAIFLGAVSGGQTALIQGMRRVSDLAKLSMLGALAGTAFSIPLIYYLGERGIVYTLLIVSATGTLTSWWYCKKIEVPVAKLNWRDSFSEAQPLLKLGLALMLGWLLTVCTQYILRVFVVRYYGLSAAGIYQASTTLSTIYVSVILNAMLTDYYPRLSAAAADNSKCKSLINDQVEIGLLLAVPGILAIMTFAPFVISIFYSSRFLPAVDILRWQILGVVLQVVTWPMGFMLRAKADGQLFFWTEFFANSMHLGLAWLGITYFGLIGIGMAFFGMSLSYWVLIYWIIRRNYEFTLSIVNIRLMSIFAFATGIVFITPYYASKNPSLLINIGVAIAAGTYSLRILFNKVGTDMTPGILLKFKSVFITSKIQ